ncbi:MAG TPA: hypothetical protein VGU43_01210 [Thermoplasmata archaeon]|nr:hypothetical protein [Thermoplasmata archaeon]
MGLQTARMTTVRVLAAHDLVAARFPREPSQQAPRARAVGAAIDSSLSQLSHESSLGRRPTLSAMQRFGAERLEELLDEVEEPPSPEVRARMLEEILGSLRAFRSSELMGLPRPRSRLVLVAERAGYFAQPDFWDRRARFFEMKSFRAIPPPPDILLQLQLFQLAFPGAAGTLVCIDRHAAPVSTSSWTVPPLQDLEASSLLAYAHSKATESGEEKVLEYIDHPIVRYGLPPAPTA